MAFGFGKKKPTNKQAEDIRILNKRVDNMLDLAREDWLDWEGIYNDGRDYLWNNQLVHTANKKNVPRMSANYIFPAVMQELSIISQRRPKIVAKPHETGDESGAVVWRGLLQWYFDKGLKLARVLRLCALDGKSNGHYTLKVFWEPEDEWDEEEQIWVGAVRTDLVRIQHQLRDPLAKRLGEQEFDGVRRRVTVNFAIDRWPEFKDEIEAAARQEQETLDERHGEAFYVSEEKSAPSLDGDAVKGETERGTGGVIEGRLSALVHGRGAGRPRAAKATDTTDEGARPLYVTITELWFKDREKEEKEVEEFVPLPDLVDQGVVALEPTEGAAGSAATYLIDGEPLQKGVNWPSTKRSIKVPKYPRGRFVRRVGPKAILEDRAWDLKFWPLVTGLNHELPHTTHGLNGVEMGRGLQDWVNIALINMGMHVMFFGQPIVMAEEGAIQSDPQNKDSESKLQSGAGSVWPLTKGALANSRIQRVPPPPMQQGIPILFNTVTKELQDQTGVQEVARGRSESKRQTGFEVARLEENSRMRVAMQSILLDEFTISVMERVLELLQRHLTPGQMVRIIGEDGAEAVQELVQGSFDAKFDLDLDVGRALPFDEEREQAKAAEMVQVFGPIPVIIEKALDAYNIENKQEALLEMQTTGIVEQIVEAVQGEDGLEQARAIIENFLQSIAPPEEEEGSPAAGEGQ